MRVLVSLHSLSVGGSHINAIEIGSLLRQRGHEVIVYAPDGPLRDLVAAGDLEFVQAGAVRRNPPSLAGLRALTALVRDRKVDLIHAYDWAPTLEASYGPHLSLGTPVLTTDYSTKVPRFVPRHLPMIVGYLNELERERRRGRREIYTIVCPVDTDANAPVADRTAARNRFGLGDDELAAVIVSRLSPDLKREGLLSATEAVGLVDPGMKLRLLIAGDGPCRAEIEVAAAAVNERLGREAVTLTGLLLDPHDAYVAADIVLGMGTSAQKGMAFAKPVVIQGERGYWETLTPDSMAKYLRQNFYGLGDGGDGALRLAGILSALWRDRDSWPDLAEFGRKTALATFSNEAAADGVMSICADVAARQRQSLYRRAQGVLGTSGWFAGYLIVRAGRQARARYSQRRRARG